MDTSSFATQAALTELQNKVNELPVPVNGVMGTTFAPSWRGTAVSTWSGVAITSKMSSNSNSPATVTVTMGNKTASFSKTFSRDYCYVRSCVGFETGFFIAFEVEDDGKVGDTTGYLYDWSGTLISTIYPKNDTSSSSGTLSLVAIRKNGVILGTYDTSDNAYMGYYGTNKTVVFTKKSMWSSTCVYNNKPGKYNGKNITLLNDDLTTTTLTDPYGLSNTTSEGYVTNSDYSNIIDINTTARTINGIPFIWINGKYVYGKTSGVPTNNGFTGVKLI